MAKKIYCALVVQEVGGNLYIEADNATDAGLLARKLLDASAGVIEPDYSADGGYKIEDMREVVEPESVEKKNAGENADALAELCECNDEAHSPEIAKHCICECHQK